MDCRVDASKKCNLRKVDFVDIWYARTGSVLDKVSSNEERKYYLQLNEETKYNSFFFEIDRNSFLASRVLLRTVFTNYVPQITPKEWRFESLENGQLISNMFSKESGLYFNLSHTDGVVGCAISNVKRIGFDVEAVSKHEDRLLSIAEDIFSQKEYNYIKKNKGKIKDSFFEVWTLKESFSKAVGIGMKLPFNKFYFNGTQINFMFDLNNVFNTQDWVFFSHSPLPSYRAAVAVASRNSVRMKYNFVT